MVEYLERRKHIRIYFKPPEVPVGMLLREEENNQAPMSCSIWGLSMGGVKLFIDGKETFQKGDRVTLVELKKNEQETNEQSLGEAFLEVGWEMYEPELNRTHLGCRFLEFSGQAKNTFEELVDEGIKQKRFA